MVNICILCLYVKLFDLLEVYTPWISQVLNAIQPFTTAKLHLKISAIYIYKLYFADFDSRHIGFTWKNVTNFLSSIPQIGTKEMAKH